MTSLFGTQLCSKDYTYAKFKRCATKFSGKSAAQKTRVQSGWALVPRRRIKKIKAKRKAFSQANNQTKVNFKIYVQYLYGTEHGAFPDFEIPNATWIMCSK